MPENFDPGVPLEHYRQHSASVELHCLKCANTSLLNLEQVIAGLWRRGLGDERTGIRAVARTFTRPCGRCGSLSWGTRPCFPSQRPHAEGGRSPQQKPVPGFPLANQQGD